METSIGCLMQRAFGSSLCRLMPLGSLMISSLPMDIAITIRNSCARRIQGPRKWSLICSYIFTSSLCLFRPTKFYFILMARRTFFLFEIYALSCDDGNSNEVGRLLHLSRSRAELSNRP